MNFARDARRWCRKLRVTSLLATNELIFSLSEKTGYWEGGQGNRNKATMARHDKRKYAGLSKTESRRAQEKKHK